MASGAPALNAVPEVAKLITISLVALAGPSCHGTRRAGTSCSASRGSLKIRDGTLNNQQQRPALACLSARSSRAGKVYNQGFGHTTPASCRPTRCSVVGWSSAGAVTTGRRSSRSIGVAPLVNSHYSDDCPCVPLARCRGQDDSPLWHLPRRSDPFGRPHDPTLDQAAPCLLATSRPAFI